jgi:hypothetical protein
LYVFVSPLFDLSACWWFLSQEKEKDDRYS